MQRNILDIFEKYDTDKNSKGHNYAPYYQKHLPDEAANILEVGVHHGASILMLHEIYPNAHIIGLDLFSEFDPPFNESWVTWIKGDQTNLYILREAKRYSPYDIIIEDGSHVSTHQWITFMALKKYCKLYVLEDAHCAMEEFYRDGLKFEETMLGKMKSGEFEYKHELFIDKISFIYGSV